MHIENNNAKAVGLNKLGSLGLLLAVVGLGFALYGVFTGDKTALQGYFYGWSFWLIMTIGCLGITALHHTVRGAWGLSILRLVEAGSSWIVWVVMAIAYIPIAVNFEKIYKWANPEYMAADHIVQKKAYFLNEPGFGIRMAIYLLLFAGYAYLMRRSSIKQDESGDHRLAVSRTNISAPYLVVYGLAVTLMATDLWMSLDAHWFSHIFGAIFMVSGALMAFALCNMIAMSGANRSPFGDVMNRGLSKDLGNFMFVFTCVWAYFSFSQYIIIYSGNLPEFTTFFYNRQDPQWGAIGLFLMVFAFLAPFLALLSPKVKSTPKYLVMIGAWILITRAVDTFWVIMPFLRYDGFAVSAYDVAALLGVGGLWSFLFASGTAQTRLIPTHDPRLKEAYEHA